MSKRVQYWMERYFIPILNSSVDAYDFCHALIPLLNMVDSDQKEDIWDRVAINTMPENKDSFNENIDVEKTDTGKMESVASKPVSEIATPTDGLTASTIAPIVSASEGITYSMEELENFDFLVGNCYTIDGSTNVKEEELDAKTLLEKDLKIDASSGEYKVLIYHTHGSEAFSDSRPGVMEDTVIGVGDELARILQEDYGIMVYHDRTVYDVIDGVEDRSLAYDMASDGIDAILEQYPSIEVVLDIHRDGVKDEVHLVRDVDGVPTAQIMFLNGMSRTNDNGDIDYLYNPYKIDNLAFSLQMHLAGKAMYGDLMRRIYIRGYCFNLNKMPRSSLIEVGAQTNTVAEAKNAMAPLGAILYKVLIAQ